MKETTARSSDLNREIRKSDYGGINEAQLGPLSWMDRIHGMEVMLMGHSRALMRLSKCIGVTRDSIG